jgi:hypothetical protein
MTAGWVLAALLTVAVLLAVAIDAALEWRERHRHAHDWEVRGTGGAGWTLLVCRDCGEREITS